ncbi:hypothetical protein PI124_g9471 [Phytophthora idaei]|nr:hypothetical protein PI125_g8707 [Phytophthora idaei]KAG3157058.1 hypothetical protein PI126_g8489 [Phytophthora idaei]KAG3245792.1 hypothetical protein PI124_g9471 [Phytophthora idaei]
MAGTNVRRWFARVFGDCLKGKRNDEVYVDWVHCVGKEGTSRVVLTPVPLINISPIRLQPCTPAIRDEPSAQEDSVLWTATNRLINAAAAWQIRRVMPVEVAMLDEFELEKMTTPELAWRFKAAPILMVLRADNQMLRQLPLELLSTESFARLTLFERRAIHNVLAERPSGWNEAQLSQYAARERELIVAANEEASGMCSGSRPRVYDSFYMVELPCSYSAYAQEPRHWDE